MSLTTDRTATRVPRQPRGKRGGSGPTVVPLRGLIPLVVLLLVWQLVGKAKSPYFPPPTAWAEAVWPLISEGDLLEALGWTSLTFILGLVLATVLGAAIGILVGSSRTTDRAAGPTLEFLRVLPAASLVPLASLILGYTMQMKLAVVLLPATWPILLSCRSARRSMSLVLLDVARSLRLSRRDRVRKVILPALIPAVLLGVRISGPLALIITLLVEIVTRINGLGAMLGDAQANFQSARVYGLLVISGALGFVVNWLVTRAEKAVALRISGRSEE